MHSNLPFEKLGDFTSALGFPIEDNGILYVVSSNGDISTFNEGKFKVLHSITPRFKIDWGVSLLVSHLTTRATTCTLLTWLTRPS